MEGPRGVSRRAHTSLIVVQCPFPSAPSARRPGSRWRTTRTAHSARSLNANKTKLPAPSPDMIGRRTAPDEKLAPPPQSETFSLSASHPRTLSRGPVPPPKSLVVRRPDYLF